MAGPRREPRLQQRSSAPSGCTATIPQWRKYREFAGGGLADMGAHHFDIAQWALRRDDSGPSRIIPPEDPAATRGLRLVYDDGIELIHDGSIDCRFEGYDGWIEAGRGYLRASDPAILETEVDASASSPGPPITSPTGSTPSTRIDPRSPRPKPATAPPRSANWPRSATSWAAP